MSLKLVKLSYALQDAVNVMLIAIIKMSALLLLQALFSLVVSFINVMIIVKLVRIVLIILEHILFAQAAIMGSILSMEIVSNVPGYLLQNVGRQIKPIQQLAIPVILLLRVLVKLVLPTVSPVMAMEPVVAITVAVLLDFSTHSSFPPATNASEDA